MLADAEQTNAPAPTRFTKTAQAERALASAEALPAGLEALAAELIEAEAGWLANADRTDEVKAEREGRSVTDDDVAIWQAASDRHWAAVDALTRYRPTSAAEFLAKARLLTNNGDTRLRTEEQFADLYLKDAEAVARLALDAVTALPALQLGWDQARAAYDAARSGYEAAASRWDEVNAGLISRAPNWNVEPLPHNGKPSLRYHSLKNFDFTRHPCDLASERRNQMVTWTVAEAEALTEFDALGEEIDRTYGALCDVERALIETPAPDLAAVVFKQQLFGKETDDDKGGYEHRPHYMAVRDASYVVTAWPVFLHEDCLRLAGMPQPHQGMLFAPRRWKNAFEAIGGKVSLGKAGKLSLNIEAVSEDASDLLAEIGLPEHREALQIWLEMLK